MASMPMTSITTAMSITRSCQDHSDQHGENNQSNFDGLHVVWYAGVDWSGG